MADEPSGLERRLDGCLEYLIEEGFSRGCDPYLAVREAAQAIGEMRRAMHHAMRLIALNTPFNMNGEEIAEADGLDEAGRVLRNALTSLKGGSHGGRVE